MIFLKCSKFKLQKEVPPLPDDLTSSMNNEMQIKPWWACSDPLPYPTLPCDVAVDALKITTQRANPSHILATICVVGSKSSFPVPYTMIYYSEKMTSIQTSNGSDQLYTS
jgi:hypothetical protein